MSDLIATFWLWKGWRAIYSAEHVNAAARMLRDYLTVDRVVCITDLPKGITECETYPLWPEWSDLRTRTAPNCFRRLRLFEPGFIRKELRAERVLTLDLDYVCLKRIDDLIPAEDVPFMMAQGHYAIYNGSMWYVRDGAYPHVWENFDAATTPLKLWHYKNPQRGHARLIGSDQAWLSAQLHQQTARLNKQTDTPARLDGWENPPVWGHKEGVVSYARGSTSYRHARAARLWFFPGGVKPWSAQISKARLPHVRRLYEQYMRYWKADYPPSHGKAGPQNVK